MRRRLIPCLFLSVVSPFACLGQSESATASAPQADIRILMSFADQVGKPMPPPAKESLRLRLDGKPVEIGEILSLKDEPLFFSVLVDASGSTQLFAEQQIAAVSKLFKALTADKNRGFLVVFNDGIAARKDAITAENVDEVIKEFPAKSRKGSTALYDAVVLACQEQLASAKLPRTARRAIVLFSDGGDNASRHSLRKTVGTAQREGIPIFSIRPARDKSTGSPRSQRQEDQALETLSGGTGGLVAILNDPNGTIQQLVGFLGSQDLVSIRTGALKARKSYSLKFDQTEKYFFVLMQTDYFAP